MCKCNQITIDRKSTEKTRRYTHIKPLAKTSFNVRQVNGSIYSYIDENFTSNFCEIAEQERAREMTCVRTVVIH